MTDSKNLPAVGRAILAAALFGLCAPFAKLLLGELPPLFMAALLYLGAGLGMLAVNLAAGGDRKRLEAGLGRADLPYVALTLALDVLAPILLLYGLRLTNPATASLLGNFEVVVTALVALLVFKEEAGRRIWLALGLITVASALLSVEDFAAVTFSPGAALVLVSCVCWGLENNCTRMLSLKDPRQIVVVKGLGSGAAGMAIALAAGEYAFRPAPVAAALLLGFVAYGLSIYFYVAAQRDLGAARTGAYYAFAPFIGALLSAAIFAGSLTPPVLAALAIMLAATYCIVTERHSHPHRHMALTHEHRHRHSDGHHSHPHSQPALGEHSHPHTHAETAHSHVHAPDLHHRHEH